MKKVFIAAALAAMIVSCGSKGNKSAEIIAESESDSIFAVNDSTLGELQTYSYEGILPAADADRKSTRLNSSHIQKSRMPSSA